MATPAQNRTGRRATTAVLALLVAALLSACLGPAQTQVQRELNADRKAHKVRTLPLNYEAQAKAPAWAERLARERQLYHSPLPNGLTRRWCSLGANVGYYIPSRIDEGYGLNDDALRSIAAGGASTAARPPAPEKERDSQGTGPVRPATAAGTTSLSKMRQAIARRMSQSKATAPHYYLTLDNDMTAALEFRSQINANATEEQRVSINDLIVKACAIALERQPQFNAEFHESGLEMHERVNICIGVALDDGLIAPAILDCQSKSLGRIAVEAKDLIGRAKSGHLRADEYSEGTFTITNLGAYGVETLIGIINPPQAAILGVGSVMPQPLVRDNQVVVRQVMKVALSADHRVSDGAEGARFIAGHISRVADAAVNTRRQ